MSLIRLSHPLSPAEKELFTQVCLQRDTTRVYILPKNLVDGVTDNFISLLGQWFDVVASVMPMLDVVPLFQMAGWNLGSIGKVAQITDLKQFCYPGEHPEEEKEITFLQETNAIRKGVGLAELPAVALAVVQKQDNRSPVESLDETIFPNAQRLSFPRVVVGGTYDHFHAGHRFLLSTCALIATEQLLVGITADGYLAKKKHKHLINSLDQRKENVLDFARTVRPNLEIKFNTLSDPNTPVLAATDPNFDAIVVSKETVSGGEAINTSRKERGFTPLHLITVELIGMSIKDKLSSTQLREIASQ